MITLIMIFVLASCFVMAGISGSHLTMGRSDKKFGDRMFWLTIWTVSSHGIALTISWLLNG